MSSSALRRSLAVNLEATTTPAGPPKNPLEEFAGLMGVDVSALELFDGAREFVPTLGTSHEPASSEIEGSSSLNKDEIPVHASSLLSEATLSADLYRSAEASVAEAPSTPRRSRASTLGVLIAVGVAGCLGAWALKGAPGPQRTSTCEAYNPIKVLPTEQKTAASRDESTFSLSGNQMDKLEPVNLESIEKQPSVFEAQTKSPMTTPSVAATPMPTEAVPSAMPAAAPVSASPVTRSIALLASAPEHTQVPVSTVAPRTAPTMNPGPKRMKAVSARSDGSDLPNDDETPAGANHSVPPSAPRTTPAPSGMVPALLNPPTPVARPSVDASAGGVLKPVKERLDAPAKLSANSVDIEPVARTASIAPNAPPPLMSRLIPAEKTSQPNRSCNSYPTCMKRRPTRCAVRRRRRPSRRPILPRRRLLPSRLHPA
jgi:hypothetical protein